MVNPTRQRRGKRGSGACQRVCDLWLNSLLTCLEPDIPSPELLICIIIWQHILSSHAKNVLVFVIKVCTCSWAWKSIKVQPTICKLPPDLGPLVFVILPSWDLLAVLILTLHPITCSLSLLLIHAVCAALLSQMPQRQPQEHSVLIVFSTIHWEMS